MCSIDKPDVSAAAFPDSGPVNVASRLAEHARRRPGQIAVIEPLRRGSSDGRYRQLTFEELDRDSSRLGAGLRKLGVEPGTRLVLLVRPGIDFVSLTFALFKVGAVGILIDPGMGKKNLLACLAEAEPDGFIAVPPVHAMRSVFRGHFPKARFNVTAGRRWFWGGVTLRQLRRIGSADFQTTVTKSDDPAAIIFTTGSTGPPKGVLFCYGNFDHQVTQIRDRYGIEPGTVDLAGFPLFGLFNAGMGATTVVPDMDPSRPAKVDPRKIAAAISDWNVTQAFGSPAMWDRVGRYCEEKGVRLASLRRVFSAGAPVPAGVLKRMKACIHPEGEIHTPYGATEALPVASIEAAEVLGETWADTDQGAGVCVGTRFGGIQWKIIRTTDDSIAAIDQVEELPSGEIGELIVTGPVVTREYVTRRESNAISKIADDPRSWHRMGDVGYLDGAGRFWYCGRKAHRVRTAAGTLYTIQCEAIFNRHPAVSRTALVGIGPAGSQRPVMIVEPLRDKISRMSTTRPTILEELRGLGRENSLTAGINDFLFHRSFPVDIRHNSKIFREQLAVWAASRLAGASGSRPCNLVN